MQAYYYEIVSPKFFPTEHTNKISTIVPTKKCAIFKKRRKNSMLCPPPSGYTFDDFSNFYLLYEMNEVKFDNS